jgi:hypothetical protein
MTKREGEKVKIPADFILLLSSGLFAVSLFLLSGCAVNPDHGAVKDSIARYFQERKYKVVSIEIGEVTSTPLRSKVYMGTEGYIVEVNSITLEVTEDSGPPAYYKRGERLTFRNAAVQIRAGDGGRWTVSHISGIPVL